MIKKLSSKKAFTIIEVVLVLGIAGLIILAVFVAVPALQRSKRNQIRKDDMTRYMQAIVAYQSSHSGKPPIYFDSTISECSYGVDHYMVKEGKGCFRINFDGFIKKLISDNLIIDKERDDGGHEYHLSCAVADGCSDFTDPNGNIYIIKAEGRGFSGGDEIYGIEHDPGDQNYFREQLREFDNIIHIAAYSKCSSLAATDKYGNGSTSKTDDPRDVTITYRLESNAVFCIDNQ